MLNQKLELNFDNFLDQIPDEKIVRNAMWDVTVLLGDLKALGKALPQVNEKPKDLDAFQPYFSNGMGILRNINLLLKSEDVPDISKDKLRKMDHLWEAYKKIVDPIVSGQKRNDAIRDKGVVILNTMVSIVDEIWSEIVDHNDVVDQLASFGNRDMTPYVKHILGYKPGVFGDAPDKVIEEFTELVKIKLCAN